MKARRFIWLLIFAYVLLCLGTVVAMLISLVFTGSGTTYLYTKDPLAGRHAPFLSADFGMFLMCVFAMELGFGLVAWRICRWTGLADKIAWPTGKLSQGR